MSANFLSTALGDVEGLIEDAIHLAEGNPQLQTSLTNAKTGLVAVQTAVEPAEQVLVDQAIAAVLATVPGGSLATPLAQNFVNALIQGLTAKLQAAVTPAVTAATATTPEP